MEILRDRRKILITVIFSSFFSVLLVFQSKIHFSGSIFQKFQRDIFQPFNIKDLFLFILLFLGMFVFFRTLAVIFFRIKKDDKLPADINDNVKACIFWGVTLLSVLIGVLFLLTSYPGTLVADSWSSIYQYLGVWKFNNHHPILFTAIVGFFLNIGRSVNDYNIGIFLFSLFQIVIMAVTEGYIAEWLYTKSHSVWVAGIAALYFLCNNIFYTYAIMVQKDTLFSVCIVLLSICLEQGNWNHWLSKFRLFLLLFAVAFLRNNGLMIDWLLFFVVLMFNRKKFPVKLIVSMLMALLLFSAVQGPVFRLLKIQTEAAESLGIPIQQIAYVINDEGEIEKEEYEFLEKVLPLEKWKEQYTPFFVDSIKNSGIDNEYLSENLLTFIKIWMKIMRRNFSRYVKAYALQTYGFWSIGTHNDYGFADNSAPVKGASGTGIYRRNILYEAVGIGFSKLKEVRFPDAGTLFWIFGGCVYLALIHEKRRSIMIYLPTFFLWITVMLATPVAFSLRYVFPFVLGLPCFVFYPFVLSDCCNDKCTGGAGAL